jgi:hypothetical protein
MSESEQVDAFLQGRDEPCPICSYNLRDLRGHKCPECGARLSLTLKGAHALDVVWYAMIAFFALVGTMMLLLGVMILQGLLRGDEWSPRTGPGIAFLVVAFLGPVFGLAIVFARRWLLRDLKGRVVLVAIPLGYLATICILLYLL